MTTVTLTNIEKRPTSDVMFYNMSPAELEYRMTTFIKSGKILYSKSDVSDDKLTRTLIIIFVNNDALIEYRNNEIISDFRERKASYNNSVGIEYTVEIVEDLEE